MKSPAFKAITVLLICAASYLHAAGLTISSGATFSLGGATLSLPGDWNNSGTFNAQTGTVVFNGASGDQNIHDGTGVSFNNLTLNKSAGNLLLHNSFTVNNLFTVTTGDVDLNGNIITLSTTATLSETAGNTVKGSSGYLTTTRTLNAPSGLDVGGLGAELTTAADLGVTEIRRGHAAQSGSGSSGITRYFDISPTQNSGLNAALIFHYDESELNGQLEPSLKLYRSTNAGASWSSEGGTPNPSDNNVALASINAFSRWTLANNLVAYDLGDAPDPTFPTLLASNGAIHTILTGFSLGASIDSENDGQPNANATGDDTAGDDEDGVTIPDLTPGQPATLSISLTNTAGVATPYLHAWIDWNRDGDWSDSGEQIATNLTLAAGANNLTITVPATASPGSTCARFRLGSTANLPYNGAAPDGEVEDYNVNLNAIDLSVSTNTLTITPIADGQVQITGTVTLANTGTTTCNMDVPMRFTLYDNNGGSGNIIDQWTQTFVGVNLPGSGTQLFTITEQTLTTNLCVNSTGCGVSFNIEADYSHVIAETNETNNSLVSNKALQIPDLTIQSITPQVVGNWQVSVRVRAANPGCGSVLGTVVRLISDCGLTFTEQSIDLAAGAAADVTFNFTPISSSCNFTATIDPNLAVGECDGTNNTMSHQYIMEWDLGDAPDPTYATLLTSNGAGHLIDARLKLGALIDHDVDGMPDAMAQGDDADGTDDEEGVTLPLLYKGLQAVIEVTVENTTGIQAYLNAWIDWNVDGDWNDASEQVVINRAVTAGSNNLLLNVPSSAVQVNTFARFRLSTEQNLTPSGFAGDGEVEDYQVAILSPTVLVLASPNGGSLNIADPLTITWLPGNNALKVDLYFSADGGTKWIPLAQNINNTGSFATFVPGLSTTNGLFKVVNSTTPAEFDVNDSPITISGANWQAQLQMEAEDAALTAPMRKWINGTSFDCEAIYSDKNNSGKAVFNVTVAKPGLYVLWGRAQAPGGTRNSFWVSCDGGDEHLWEIRKGDGVWYWQRLSEPDMVLLNLTAGAHQITVRSRENYTRLDRIVLTNDLTAEYHWMNPDHWVQIIAPHDSLDVVRGEPFEILWKSWRIAANVAIDLSFDLGVTFPLVITPSTPDDGSFIWDVPFLSQEKATLRIREAGRHSCPWDVMWGKFQFVNPPPKLWVMTPNGGDTLFAGDTYQVQWRSRAFTGTVDLHYSLDNGQSWLLLANAQPDSGVYTWTLPNTATDSALVRVAASAGAAPADTSDAVFKIMIREVAPLPNFALAFDGIDDFVQVPHDASLNITRKFTIAFWFKTDDPAQKWSRILEKGAFDEYYVSFYGATDRMCAALRTAIPGGSRMNNIVGPSASAIPVNTWVHAALTFDGAQTRLYLNGRLESMRAATAAPRDLLKDLFIGAAKHGNIYEYHYEGLLDELSLWNVARSEAEINQMIFNRLTTYEPGLVAYYDFDEGQGQELTDLSPFRNNGQLGKTNGEDYSDPEWIESNRPSGVTALARLPLATKELDEEEPLEPETALPQTVSLQQNYPNPFNPVTAIVYQIPEEMQVRLTVYDVQGREIARLVETRQAAGQYTTTWDAIALPSGFYFYCLEAGSFKEIKRMLLLK